MPRVLAPLLLAPMLLGPLLHALPAAAQPAPQGTTQGGTPGSTNQGTPSTPVPGALSPGGASPGGAPPGGAPSAEAPAQPASPSFVVFFTRWCANFDDPAEGVIRQAAQKALSDQGTRLTVTAYADNAGSVAADHYLTELRAQRVTDELVHLGVPRRRIVMVARGRQRGHGLADRRVEITFSPLP